MYITYITRQENSPHGVDTILFFCMCSTSTLYFAQKSCWADFHGLDLGVMREGARGG